MAEQSEQMLLLVSSRLWYYVFVVAVSGQCPAARPFAFTGREQADALCSENRLTRNI